MDVDVAPPPAQRPDRRLQVLARCARPARPRVRPLLAFVIAIAMLAAVAACRAFLLVVFAVAVLSKTATAARRRAFASAVAAFGVGPAPAPLIAAAVVASELAAVALLCAAPARGCAASAALLAVFTLAIARALRTGKRVACRCFGSSGAALGASHAVRNALLLAVAVAGTAMAAAGTGAGHIGLSSWCAATIAGGTAGAVMTRWDDVAYALGFTHGPMSRGAS